MFIVSFDDHVLLEFQFHHAVVTCDELSQLECYCNAYNYETGIIG